GAVSIEQLSALHRELGVVSAADLSAAVEAEAIRTVAGLGPEDEYRIAAALLHLREAVPRIPLGRATALVEPILARLAGMAGVRWAAPAGSLRRGQDTVGDVEIVAASADP